MFKINFKTFHKSFFTVFITVFLFSIAYSQDGEKIFKANCASCHHPIKNATGPKMQGALQKWKDAGEEELIYKWVANPTELYNSGKSKMAKAIWDYSPTAMTAQGHLSREEVEAVFAYVDAYAPPVVAGGGAEELVLNIDKGETDTFWWWVISSILVFTLFAILGVKRELNIAVAVKEGKEIDNKETFITEFRSWIVRNWFVTTILILVIALFSGVEIFGRAFQLGVFSDYQPSQSLKKLEIHNWIG